MTDQLYFDKIETYLSKQDNVISEVIQSACATVREAIKNPETTEDEFAEILIGFEQILKSCDGIYDALTMMLMDHLTYIRETRVILSQSILSMGEINGSSVDEWVDNQQKIIKLTKPKHLTVVSDE